MTKIPLNQKLLALSCIIVAGIGLTGYVVYQSNQKLANSVRWVQHTQLVLYQSGNILLLAKDIETASRGFIISNDSTFLQPLWAADKAFSTNISQLKSLTSDNPRQQLRIDSLNVYMKQRLDFSFKSVELRSNHGLAAASALVATGQGKRITDHIRQITDNLQQEESALLKQRQKTNEQNIATFNSALVALFVVLILLTFLLLFIAGSYLRQQQEHSRQVTKWNNELDKRIKELSDFKAMFESAPGLYLILLPNLIIDAVSDEYLQATMTKRNEIVGKPLFEVFPENPDDPGTDGISNLRTSFNTVIETKTAHAMAVLKYDIRRPDGIFEERYWSPFNKPVIDEKGELIYIINSVVDVTQLIRNEREILRANDEIKELYDQAPCGYFSVDSNIFIVNINQTLLHWLGYSGNEVVGKMKYEDLLTPKSRAAHLSTFNEVFASYLENGYVNDLEYEFQRKDGTTFPALVNSIAVFDDNGNFVKSRSTVFNHTERKKAEERLKAANKELESFSYSVSHDLRAPLRGVHGFTQILMEDYGHQLDAEAQRLMNNIMSNAQKMGQLIDDLLSFSRLSRKELVKMNLSMQHMAAGICNDLKTEKNGHKLEFKINDLVPVEADSVAIKQVWINLISNAVKYSGLKQTAQVEIGSSLTEGEVIYYVKDNGVGFDMRYVGKLFGVFQRLHSDTEFEGTGVGLAIVHRIITRHGGKVWAEGKKNEGATFYFSLPKKNNHE